MPLNSFTIINSIIVTLSEGFNTKKGSSYQCIFFFSWTLFSQYFNVYLIFTSSTLVWSPSFKKQKRPSSPQQESLVLYQPPGTGRAWFAQLVRSLLSSHRVPSSILDFAEIRIFVWPSFPPKLTQLSILPG